MSAALRHTFATRCPQLFASHLSAMTDVPYSETERIVQIARAEHEEAHLALEFLSELALRSSILRRMKCNEEQFNFMLGEMCCFNEETGSRLKAVLQKMGIGKGFFWEDIVTRSLQG